MTILIAGDYCIKDRTADILNSESSESILYDIAPITHNCDISIVNLECPLLDIELKPIAKEGPNLKAGSKAAQLLKEAGFNVVTLANNHILDYGQEGLNSTLKTLERQNIQHVGVGNNIQEAQKILYFENKGKKIAIINCCEHEFSIATEITAGANPLNPTKQYYSILEAKKEADYVLVIVHGGHEFYPLPSPRMQDTYRFFVDCGADVVINHHQHCYSGYEIYNGKPIFYGLGNFCFDWQGKRDSTWNTGYMVKLDLKYDVQFSLYPYEQCNKEAKVRLLNNEEKKEFEQDIKRLNDIIKNHETLKVYHEQWIMKDEKNWLISLSRCNNRYINALVRRGFLPLHIEKKKLTTLLNRVNCESHRDKLIYILNRQI